MKMVEGTDISFEASPTEPIIALFGCLDEKYGVTVYRLNEKMALVEVDRMCLTHQVCTFVIFSSLSAVADV